MIEINKSLLQGFLPCEKCVFGESWFPSKNECVSCHQCSTGNPFKWSLGNRELVMSPLCRREIMFIHSVSTDKENFVALAWFPACELPRGSWIPISSWSLNVLICKRSIVIVTTLKTTCVILKTVLLTKQKLFFNFNWKKVYYILLTRRAHRESTLFPYL